MQQTIKICQRIAALVCLGAVLTFAGCSGCNNKPNGGDTTVKKDSAAAMKKDSDSTAVKKSQLDSTGNPPAHLPKADSAVKPRPIDRKT